MTIRHMRIFVTVCECESITVAAEKLYMTQPAVSLAIKELERNYGVKLFDRLTRSIRITSDGKRLLDYAVHLVALFDEMEQAMKNADAAGEIKIGSSLTIGACLLPGYAQRLKEKRPDINLRITVDNTDNIIKSTRVGEIDIGFVEGAVNDASLVVKPFMRDRLIAICSRFHRFSGGTPVELGEFLSEPLLLRERGSGAREMFTSAVTLMGMNVDPAWESVSTTAIIRAVEAGNGVSVLPEKLVLNYISSGALSRVDLKCPSLSRSYCIIYHKNKYISEGMKELMDIACA